MQRDARVWCDGDELDLDDYEVGAAFRPCRGHSGIVDRCVEDGEEIATVEISMYTYDDPVDAAAETASGPGSRPSPSTAGMASSRR